MWTNENRDDYDRGKLRYPSELAEAEWGLVGPLIPPAKRGGHKRTVDIREVLSGLMYGTSGAPAFVMGVILVGSAIFVPRQGQGGQLKPT